MTITVTLSDNDDHNLLQMRSIEDHKNHKKPFKVNPRKLNRFWSAIETVLRSRYESVTRLINTPQPITLPR